MNKTLSKRALEVKLTDEASDGLLARHALIGHTARVPFDGLCKNM